MALRASLDTNTEVTLHSAVSSLAFPTGASDGASIAVALTAKVPDVANAGAWKRDGGGHVDAAIFIATSAAQTFSGGLGLYGYRTSKSKWYLVGQLNSGAAIATLGSATGFACVIEFAAIFDRLAIGPLTAVAVTTGAGTTTISAAMIRTIEAP